MPSTMLGLRQGIGATDLRPVVYEFLVLGSILVFTGFATLLPGVQRTVPGIEVPLRAVVIAIGTVAVVIGLVHAAGSVRSLVESMLDGPDQTVADAGRMASALVQFVAILVAYRGLGGVVMPRLAAGGAVWAYDVGFLILALGPLVAIARRLWRNLDVFADHLTGAIVGRAAGSETRIDA